MQAKNDPFLANIARLPPRMPPGKNMDSIMVILRSGMWRLYYQLSAVGRERFFTRFLPLLHDTKTEILGDRDDDSWYLVYIGTRPEARGKGFGRKLIENVTNKADIEGRACYLESSNVVNVGIYERLGFKQMKRVELEKGDENGNGGLELDIMVREPVARSE
jgi:ribosomal protein S18 acetylase RimI-like enzyme